jgi:putative FmdB family regulatory protein
MSPLYEYECEGGHRFEQIRSIDKRLNVDCPDCEKVVDIRISAPRKALMAHTFTTYGHDGRIIGQKQTTERTPIAVRKHSGKVVNL